MKYFIIFILIILPFNDLNSESVGILCIVDSSLTHAVGYYKPKLNSKVGDTLFPKEIMAFFDSDGLFYTEFIIPGPVKYYSKSELQILDSVYYPWFRDTLLNNTNIEVRRDGSQYIEYSFIYEKMIYGYYKENKNHDLLIEFIDHVNLKDKDLEDAYYDFMFELFRTYPDMVSDFILIQTG